MYSVFILFLFFFTRDCNPLILPAGSYFYFVRKAKRRREFHAYRRNVNKSNNDDDDDDKQHSKIVSNWIISSLKMCQC